MAKSKWDANDIPDQKGRVFIVTGATSGLGKEATKVLARKTATVVMAVRNTQKAEGVAKEIRNEFPNAKIDIRHLDLTSLESVQSFADGILADYDRLDVLINNAGIMASPFSRTKDGFEIQMGTNHLGHFALTGHLMPLLKCTKNSRIVVTSSIAHRQGDIDFSDINWEKRDYNTSKAYGNSKLANLYFTYELARMLERETDAPIVTASHPGWTRTELQRHSGFFQFLNPFFSQTVEDGVLPTLRAAIDSQANSGDYFGPSGMMELRGDPVIVPSNERSYDETAAKQLWALSEELTDVHF
jgi:NAD(P)-dependent dehydrogenase (short-subunit alcohol dehydrogenase family)